MIYITEDDDDATRTIKVTVTTWPCMIGPFVLRLQNTSEECKCGIRRAACEYHR
jgi:hypothetical protein